jgi:hypothetical protein
MQFGPAIRSSQNRFQKTLGINVNLSTSALIIWLQTDRPGALPASTKNGQRDLVITYQLPPGARRREVVDLLFVNHPGIECALSTRAGHSQAPFPTRPLSAPRARRDSQQLSDHPSFTMPPPPARWPSLSPKRQNQFHTTWLLFGCAKYDP